jgi:hypothetical protein
MIRGGVKWGTVFNDFYFPFNINALQPNGRHDVIALDCIAVRSYN